MYCLARVCMQRLSDVGSMLPLGKRSVLGVKWHLFAEITYLASNRIL